MRVVHLNVDHSPFTDCRVRKTLQWQRLRGFDDVRILNGYAEPPVDCIAWKAAELEGYPLFMLNAHRDWQTRRVVEEIAPDVVHCHELDALWALMTRWAGPGGRMLAREAVERGLATIEKPPMRIIYEAHEYERDRVARGLPDEVVEDRIWREEQCAPLVDEMIAVSPSIVEQTEKDLGIVPKLIPNSPFYRKVERSAEIREAIGAKDSDKIVVFCGNITNTRGLGLLAEVMRELGDGWRVVLVGELRAAPDEELDALEAVNAHVLDPRPYPYHFQKESFLELLSGADVAWTIGDMRVSNVRMWLPNKFFEYAWAGLPQVVNAASPDVARLCREYQIGIPVWTNGHDLTDASDVADAVWRAADLSMGGRRDFQARWCWEETGGRVVDWLYKSKGNHIADHKL